ncbi:glycosyltransferase involved in cell wall biosynthesis [Sphingomonas jinjuensis]|uniref:Glycosyltransferase involved in cell wall biosynthesis n=1 Tax=Sphingomonas jinjuensis TaxID=535907 RepID=A0A840FDY1_9SPHN|nr:glycosyltransferase involved in cell wall biosynthesis [Sphingomonas jinjuensis]
MTQSAIDISLLVCTRNRSASLSLLLASITDALSAAPSLTIDIVIVDNGSTDDTASIVEQWRAKQATNVTLLHEPRAGLARARNRALAAAGGAIIAMTDDDCRLHRDYFTALAACFAGLREPVVIGGRILPGDPADLPITVKTEDHPMVAPARGFPGGFVMGANLAFTADVLTRVGDFDERFGAGAPFVAAEDTDFLFRALGAGIPVLYDPRFTVAHHHGRRAVTEETALLAGYGFGDGALYAKHLFRDRRVLPILLRDLASLAKDRRAPVTIHRGIRHFYRFRLRHTWRGMVAYAAARQRR